MKTSIIITSYNYENYIREAIESVINQTYPDWELIIVDDGSKDNSIKIIKEYCEKDSRIKLYTHPNNKNKGLKESLLLGLSMCSYEWIAFLESDDSFAPNYLEEKIKMIKKYPQVALIYNDTSLIGDSTKFNLFNKYFENLQSNWENIEYQDVFDLFGVENIVPTFSCAMCKKSALLNCNFDTPLIPLLDYWLWWQMAEHYQFCFINQKLTNWRLHQTSYLRTSLKTLNHNIKRAYFVPSILKLFKRTPKLTQKNKSESKLSYALAFYVLNYIKKNIPQFIKKPIRKLFAACGMNS